MQVFGVNISSREEASIELWCNSFDSEPSTEGPLFNAEENIASWKQEETETFSYFKMNACSSTEIKNFLIIYKQKRKKIV